ncbi:MAG: hypothetical protein IH975_07840 [Nitrospinae bacterium]|nr:hypothetical protein [Nitrospinota bacterium]
MSRKKKKKKAPEQTTEEIMERVFTKRGAKKIRKVVEEIDHRSKPPKDNI